MADAAVPVAIPARAHSRIAKTTYFPRRTPTMIVGGRGVGAGAAGPPLLILDRVEGFLDQHGLGRGPVAAQRIGEGQSNVTFLLTRGRERFVLRRGPRPPLPPSAHDMLREARLLRALARTGVPVPEVLAVCEDRGVLGVPFYVMRYLDGPIITATLPVRLNSNAQRRRISEQLVDTLVAIHAIDYAAAGLSTFGRPDGYLRRQVERFAMLWEQNTRRDLPAVAALADWLGRNVPDSGAPSVVHGDYRLGNLIFARSAPARVLAVLDWERATIGDPLADAGYLAATYGEDGCPPSPLELSPVTRLRGFLTRQQLLLRYAERSGRAVDSLGWYQALALWKAAIFCEAIHTRWLNGERPGDMTFAPALETGVPVLLELAQRATA